MAYDQSIYILFFILLFCHFLFASGHATVSSSCIDGLTPFAEADAKIFVEHRGLERMLAHLVSLRRMHIVSARNSSFVRLLGGRTKWVDERSLSFYTVFKDDGWVLQQVIKLRAPLEIPGICANVFVVDADIIFARPFHIRHTTQPPTFNYLVAASVPKGYLQDFGQRSNNFVREALGYNSTNSPGPLCNVHHMMLLQRDVLLALSQRVAAHTGTTLLDIFQRAMHNSLYWISEFDLYFTFTWSMFRYRMHIAHLPFLHCRSPHNCTEADAQAFRAESDIHFLSCHDNWSGSDVCVNSDRCNISAALLWSPDTVRPPQIACRDLTA